MSVNKATQPSRVMLTTLAKVGVKNAVDRCRNAREQTKLLRDVQEYVIGLEREIRRYGKQ